MTCICNRQPRPPDKILQNSRSMTTKIASSQTSQRFIFGQFRHRRNTLFQKRIRTFTSFIFPTTYNPHLLRTSHKAGHTMIIRYNPRTVKMLGNLLPRQAFFPTKNFLQQIMTFRIELFRNFQVMPLRIRLISRYNTPGGKFQHPPDIFCCYEMPCRTHYMSPQDFTITQCFFHSLNRC